MNFFPVNICSVCVPCFYIVSGFFFFNNIQDFSLKIYKNKLKTRIRTLVIPYFLWNVIGLILCIIKFEFLGFPSFGIIDNGTINLLRVIEGFWDLTDGYPYAFAFWFIRNLIIFVIVSPVAYFIARRKIGFIIFIIILCVFSIYTYQFEYFIIGAFLSLNKNKFLFNDNVRLAVISFVLWMSISFIKTELNVWKFYTSLNLIQCFAAFICIQYIAFRCINFEKYNIFRSLISATFYIYAIHQFFCTMPRKFYLTIFGNSFWGVTISFIMSFLTLVIVSFLIYLIMKKLFPSTLKVLGGNR